MSRRRIVILSLAVLIVLLAASTITIAIRGARTKAALNDLIVLFVPSSEAGTPQSGVWVSSKNGCRQFGLAGMRAELIESVYELPDNGGLAYIVGRDVILSRRGSQRRWNLPYPDPVDGEWFICGYDRLDHVLILSAHRHFLRINIERGTHSLVNTVFLSHSLSTADGRLMAGEDDSQNTVLVSTRTGAVIRTLGGLQSGISAISPDGDTLAICGAGGRTTIYDIRGSMATPVKELPRPWGGTIWRLVWTPDGKYLVFEVAKLVGPWGGLAGEHFDSVLSVTSINTGHRVLLPFVVKRWCWGLSPTSVQ